jgi:hypothetical protein
MRPYRLASTHNGHVRVNAFVLAPQHKVCARVKLSIDLADAVILVCARIGGLRRRQ